MPETIPMNPVKTKTIKNNVRLSLNLNTSSLPEIWLKTGRHNTTNTMAINKAKNEIRIASVKNCLINWLRAAPITLRMPTSLALFKDLTVDRFMKFKQAINKTNKAIPKNIYT